VVAVVMVVAAAAEDEGAAGEGEGGGDEGEGEDETAGGVGGHWGTPFWLAAGRKARRYKEIDVVS
jgi:hypothetical protein